MNVLDLFSGIGGFSLGLERAGMRTAAFCEIDKYCQRVLAKHWPGIKCYDDIRTLTAARLHADGINNIDLICGGFPCQDISVAGKGAGIEGERSGLWSEYARIIGEVRPRYVIVENVAALLGRGLDRVLGDLAALGFDAEWHCIPASAVGAPHRRDRVWIVANASERRCGATGGGEIQQPGRTETIGASEAILANTTSQGRRSERTTIARETESGRPLCQPCGTGDVSDADSAGLSQWHVRGKFETQGIRIFQGRELERAYATTGEQQWLTEPAVGRLVNGIPRRVDRLRALGNAVVPQIPEMIGRAILSYEESII